MIINKKIILGLLLVSMTNLHAEPILCPDINIIQNAATEINIATKFNGTYTVYTEDYIFNSNRIYWRVGARWLKASSDEEALRKGREIVQRTVFKEQEEAIQLNPVEYRCTYEPEHVYALGAKL